MTAPNAKVAIVMGSQSDWETMTCAAEVLDELASPPMSGSCPRIAHPTGWAIFAKGAAEAGFEVIIAGAGGAAHLPGMIAALTHVPVLGVPVQSRALSKTACSRSCRACRRPVGTLAIGKAGYHHRRPLRRGDPRQS